MTTKELRAFQFPPLFLRIVQLFGIFPFQISSDGSVVKDSRLVILVSLFLTAFYALFNVSAQFAYLKDSKQPDNLWSFLSTYRIYVSVGVLNLTILWNLIQRKSHQRLLMKLKELREKVVKFESGNSDRRILNRTLRNFLILLIFDWLINAPLVIYTNTFDYLLWPSVFWACVTFQNYISNVLILYLDHLTRLLTHPVEILTTKLLNDKQFINYNATIEILVIYEGVHEAIGLFRSTYGVVILLNFIYDFVFIVSQFFLTTFFIINEVEGTISLIESIIFLRSIVFIIPNIGKLILVTFMMERINVKVIYFSYEFIFIILIEINFFSSSAISRKQSFADKSSMRHWLY